MRSSSELSGWSDSFNFVCVNMVAVRDEPVFILC